MRFMTAFASKEMLPNLSLCQISNLSLKKFIVSLDGDKSRVQKRKKTAICFFYNARLSI